MKEELTRDLQKRLSYHFINIDLLREAITHKSYVNENPELNAKDNERLEFLGDAVLDLSISSYLVEHFPDYQEGELSKLKSMMVSEPSLSRIASELDIGEYLLLGRGEEHTGGRKKESLLANALEAIIAAIYLDGGLPAADGFIRMVFVSQIQAVTRDGISLDYKTDLQEYCQGHNLELPLYRVSKETGPDHRKTFEVELLINGEVLGLGIGRNKKEAEQRAAKEALKYLTSKS
ncbi:MAG: ribonuclease III [Nitrospirae bacterium]|nr:ribonuclease III [Nitrospirota bacterium]